MLSDQKILLYLLRLQMVEISIIIPNLNMGDKLKLCLESISNQSNAPRYEIIVVDGGSTDNSIDIAKKFGCKVYVDKKSLGSQRQTGLLNSIGKYVIFTDADVVVFPDWLYQFYQGRYEKDAIIGAVKMYNPSTRIGKAIEELLELDNQKMIYRNSDRALFAMVNLFLKRDIALRVGLDTLLPTNEDGDFSYRFKSLGYKAYYSKNAVVYHMFPQTLRSLFNRERKIGAANIILYIKYKKWWAMQNFIGDMLYPISPFYWHRILFSADINSKLHLFLIGWIKFLAKLSSIFFGVSKLKFKKKFYRIN